jgi:hypothetical protein
MFLIFFLFFYGIVYGLHLERTYSMNPCKKYIELQPIYFYLSYRVACVYSPYTIVEM